METDRLELSAGFCFLFALLLLLVPLKWLLSGVVAAVFHELCHLVAIRVRTGRRSGLRLHAFAAHMPMPEMSRGREAICALAGPIGGLCLVMLSRTCPRVAVCATLQSAYNLLPVYPLDGGRALQCLLVMRFTPPKAMRIGVVVAFISKAGIVLVALYGCFILKLGLFPLLLALLLLMRAK